MDVLEPTPASQILRLAAASLEQANKLNREGYKQESFEILRIVRTNLCKLTDELGSLLEVESRWREMMHL
jgi:hypothetical protein